MSTTNSTPAPTAVSLNAAAPTRSPELAHSDTVPVESVTPQKLFEAILTQGFLLGTKEFGQPSQAERSLGFFGTQKIVAGGQRFQVQITATVVNSKKTTGAERIAIKRALGLIK